MPASCRPRGAWLIALALCAAMTAAGEINLLAPFVPGGAVPLFQAALAAMIPVGAFFASLPGRIRKNGPGRSTRRGCVRCFLAGLATALVFGLSGYEDGRLLTGLAQGSASAWTFALTASLTALAVHAFAERRRSA